MQRRVMRFGLWTALCMGAGLAQAAPQTWFAPSNHAALSRGVLLPVVGQGPALTAVQSEQHSALDLVSEYVFERKGNEQITLDGETTRLATRYRRGLGGGWELSAELPVYSLGGGFLDSFIERWHGWFGLPGGGREQAPRDRLLYQYRVNNLTVYEQSRSGAGFGDLRLGLGKQLSETLTLRSQLQLPTGNERLLTGGAAGIAAWLDALLPLSTGRGYASLGASLNQKGEALPALQRPAVLFGGLGYAYPWSARLELAAQLYAHTPLYQGSALDSLRRPGLQLSTGLLYHWSEGLSLHAGFSEDVMTRSSPDFSLHFGYTLR